MHMIDITGVSLPDYQTGGSLNKTAIVIVLPLKEQIILTIHDVWITYDPGKMIVLRQ